MSDSRLRALADLRAHCAKHNGLHCLCTICESCCQCALCGYCRCRRRSVVIDDPCDGPDLAAAEMEDGRA